MSGRGSEWFELAEMDLRAAEYLPLLVLKCHPVMGRLYLKNNPLK